MTARPFAELRDDYAGLWRHMVVRPDRIVEVEVVARRLMESKTRYAVVEQATTVPWFVVGLIHYMEADANFHCHLHNGDPLTARTVHVPKGHPLSGEPPFQWEASAIDALQLDQLDKVTVWPIERVAYELELYNGFGYRAHGINTPYLWSFTNNYTRGKFIADGVWSADAVSGECGGMAILQRMMAADSSIASALGNAASSPLPAPITLTPIPQPHPPDIVPVAENKSPPEQSGWLRLLMLAFRAFIQKKG